MNLEKLGYTENWIKFGVLDEALLTTQMKELASDKEAQTEHYRFYTFMDWLESKKKLSDKEVEQFIILAREDSHELMAGSAVKKLFSSKAISNKQFDLYVEDLRSFGKWTNKFIQFQELTKTLPGSENTYGYYEACLTYKNKYRDSRLLVEIIKKTTSHKILLNIGETDCGKRIKKLASKRLAAIQA